MELAQVLHSHCCLGSWPSLNSVNPSWATNHTLPLKRLSRREVCLRLMLRKEKNDTVLMGTSQVGTMGDM